MWTPLPVLFLSHFIFSENDLVELDDGLLYTHGITISLTTQTSIEDNASNRLSYQSVPVSVPPNPPHLSML